MCGVNYLLRKTAICWEKLLKYLQYTFTIRRLNKENVSMFSAYLFTDIVSSQSNKFKLYTFLTINVLSDWTICAHCDASQPLYVSSGEIYCKLSTHPKSSQTFHVSKYMKSLSSLKGKYQTQKISTYPNNTLSAVVWFKFLTSIAS